MKKLALASVAFAGVTAFGAGDSFAVGFTPYTSMTGFSFTDTTVWNNVGNQAAGSTGGTASFSHASTIKHIGATATFEATTTTMIPTLTVFNQGCPPGVHGVCAGFAPNTHVLGDNAFEGTGTISLAFTQHLSALGFQLSPHGEDWSAEATFFSGAGTVTSPYTKIDKVTLPNHQLCNGTAFTGCTNPAFLGLASTTPITAASISLVGAGPLYLGTLDEKLFSSAKIPEPATLSLLGAGLLGLGALRRRRRGRDPADGSRWSPFGRWRVANGPPDAKHLLK
jgi:hypothetical protein